MAKENRQNHRYSFLDILEKLPSFIVKPYNDRGIFTVIFTLLRNRGQFFCIYFACKFFCLNRVIISSACLRTFLKNTNNGQSNFIRIANRVWGKVAPKYRLTLSIQFFK